MRSRKKSILKITGLVLVAGFVVLQFFRPVKNDTPSGPNDLFALHPASAEVERLVRASCYDCHSNRTRYPWYAEIQPSAWWLAQHIADGKRELNFSEFGAYAGHRQGQKLLAVADEVHGRTMPLKSYTWVHRDARLDAAQIKMLVDWAEELAEEIDSGK
jgi:hypothetical protein